MELALKIVFALVVAGLIGLRLHVALQPPPQHPMRRRTDREQAL